MARKRPLIRLRTLAGFISGLCLFIALVLGGGLLWLRSSLPEIDGTLTLPGLTAAVTIVRDDDGIPHIRAETTSDAYFALGFVHAQDRLWQMEATRRAGEGRLAEIVGKAGLPSDRFARVLGYERLARSSLNQLSPEARAAIDAYTAGINAWLQSHHGALPPEFLALRFTPEPWLPEDCLIWGKLMATRLSNWPVLIARLRVAAKLAPEDVADLFPPYPSGGPVTIDDALQHHSALDGAAARITTHYSQALPLFGTDSSVPVEASNAFVLSGTHTDTGKPLLANDPHLGFDSPNLWYLARIDAPGLTLAGATVPGVPFLIIGHNSHVGWGFTTTGAEADALFAERLDPTDPTRVLVPDGSRPLTIRSETIAVAGGEPAHLTVREGPHGPILSDAMPIPSLHDGEIAALSSPSLRTNDRTAEALYRINYAETADTFRDALQDFQAPMQNVMFADILGNIGFIVAGLMPIRGSIDDAGLRAGWNDAANDPFIPFEQMPQIMDPPKGLIINANSKVVGESYPHFLATFWAGPERAKRIEQRLASDQHFDVTSLASIQIDAVSLGAQALLPRLLPMVADAGLDGVATVARNRLANWDGNMRRDQPEPLIYHAWVMALAHSIAAARELGNDPALAATIARPSSLMRILDNPERWCVGLPKEETENYCQPLVAGAFATAIEDLTKIFGEDPLRWRWGAAHRAVFSHRLFSAFPLLDRLTTIDVATDGDDDTVNRGTVGFNVGAKGTFFYHPPLYPGVHGAGLRMVLNLADLDKSLFMQATGQSGNPLSPHYRDLIQRWASGRYIFLSSGFDADRGLILTPPARPKP